MEVFCVVGARPNFMKIAPVLRAMEAHSAALNPILVHTGQHCDEAMSDIFFEQLRIRRPDFSLGISGGSHAKQTAAVMVAVEQLLEERRSDLVLVVGDVNSTLASSLAAAKLNIPVGHIEAGLRSHDRSMPEEVNRLVVDSISSLLFTPSPDGDAALLAEGHPRERIFCVGNVMIDTLLDSLDRAQHSGVFSEFELQPNGYVLATLHRPSNVDHPEILTALLRGLRRISRESPVVLPLHPRTRARIRQSGLEPLLKSSGISVLPPLGYLDFLALQAQSRLVITDSGGVQEETSALGIPCLTVRENTERPVTVTQGTNELVGTSAVRMVERALAILDGEPRPAGNVPEFWDGHAAERIVDVVLRQFAACRPATSRAA